MRETGYYIIREFGSTPEIAYWDGVNLKWVSLYGGFRLEGVNFENVIRNKIDEMDDVNLFNLQNNNELIHKYEKMYLKRYYDSKEKFEFKW